MNTNHVVLDDGVPPIEGDWMDRMLAEALAVKPAPKPEFGVAHREWERKEYRVRVDAYALKHRRDITEMYRASVDIFNASAARTKQTRQLTCTQAAEVAWTLMQEVKEVAHQQR